MRSGVCSPIKNSQNGTNTKLRLCMQNSTKNILCVQHKIPNSVCRAELGRYLLIIKIQKITVQFYTHLKGSDSQTFHNKAITYREINLEKRPLSKLVLRLSSKTQTDHTEHQDSNTIRPNQIMGKQKDDYLTHWKELTKKLPKADLALKRRQAMCNSVSWYVSNCFALSWPGRSCK